MHRIRFRRELTALPRPLAGFKRAYSTSKGREGRRGWEGMEGIAPFWKPKYATDWRCRMIGINVVG